MEVKTTSSGTIKTFAQVIFIIGIVVVVLSAIALVVGGWKYSSIRQNTGLFVLSAIGAVIFVVGSILLLFVERAFLFSYAEMAEDLREMRNILAKRDSNT